MRDNPDFDGCGCICPCRRTVGPRASVEARDFGMCGLCMKWWLRQSDSGKPIMHAAVYEDEL